jgi:hypothetical protein
VHSQKKSFAFRSSLQQDFQHIIKLQTESATDRSFASRGDQPFEIAHNFQQLFFELLLRNTPYLTPHKPNTMKFSVSALVLLAVATNSASAFSTALFPEATSATQQTFPTKQQGEEVELPNFDELFERIQQVSPLSRAVLQGDQADGPRGFAAIDKAAGKC